MSVCESILEDLVETLQGIQEADGFGFSMQSVERFDVDGNSLVETPAAIVAAVGQDKVAETSRTMEWDLKVRINAYIVHDKGEDARSTDTILTLLADDLYKAVMADRTRGGHAVLTTVESLDHFDLIHDEGRDTGVMALLSIRFRHAVLDPAVAV